MGALRFCTPSEATLMLACLAAAQGLSPELELQRIRSHMRDELSHLPNYTCLETLSRFQNKTSDGFRAQGRLDLKDTVRLEIVYSDHKEWYGAPGDRNLSSDNPLELVGSGMMGTGAFAMILSNIFESGLITYRGQEEFGGRPAAKYDFRMPGKALEISIPGGYGMVGLEGSFWVDSQSLDLLRLDTRAIDIPPYLPLEESSTKVSYARMRIGERVALLAQQADMHMLETKGVESYDRIEFTHCRAFSVQSAIRYGSESHDTEESPADGRKTPSGAGADVRVIPPFLPVTVQLTTPVTDKDAVGKLIEAKVSGDVVQKGKIVIPNGSRVQGRIRRLERYRESASADFIVALEFTEVEIGGGPVRFYADLEKIDKRPGIRHSLSDQVLLTTGAGVESRPQTITLPELPGIASFFVQGKTFTLPAGFRTVWKTRGFIRGVDR